MQRERRKLNQAGMTLIELVVVVLIIGILSVGSGIGVSYANRMNATGAAEKLNSMLSRTRLLTLASDSTVELKVTMEDDSYYGTIIEGGSEVDKVKLGNKALTLTVDFLGSVPDVEIDSDNACGIFYEKSNGAFAKSSIYVSGTLSVDEYCTAVEIAGSDTRTVRLVKATGRSYLD